MNLRASDSKTSALGIETMTHGTHEVKLIKLYGLIPVGRAGAGSHPDYPLGSVFDRMSNLIIHSMELV